MKRYTQIKTISCDLTAEQWQLYSYSMSCGNAARSLNKAVKDAFKKYPTDRVEFERFVSNVQGKYAEQGACDTEPNWVRRDIASELYPDSTEEW